MKGEKDVIKEFNEVVNMTASELEKWLKSDDSNSAGWPKEGEDGESVGHDSGRKITEILKSNPKKDPSKYTDDQVDHMRKVVAYCKRHLAQEEKTNDQKSAEEVKKTKSYASLKNWGHDPLKKRGEGGDNAEDDNGDEGEEKEEKKGQNKKQNGGKKEDEDEEMKDEDDDDEDDAKDDKEEKKQSHAGDKRKQTRSQTGANKARKTRSSDNATNSNDDEDDEEYKEDDEEDGGEEEEEEEDAGEHSADGQSENDGKKQGAKKGGQQNGRKSGKQSNGKAQKKQDSKDDKEDNEEEEEEEGGEEEDDNKKSGKQNGGSKAEKGPNPGDTVSWNWGSGQPKGKVLDVKPEKTSIETKRGNEVSRDGSKDDPAVVLDTGKSKAIKSNHELN